MSSLQPKDKVHLKYLDEMNCIMTTIVHQTLMFLVQFRFARIIQYHSSLEHSPTSIIRNCY